MLQQTDIHTLHTHNVEIYILIIFLDVCDGEDSCCTESNQCGVNEGDCDSDVDCKGDLVCGIDNCNGPNFDSTDDCCTIGTLNVAQNM